VSNLVVYLRYAVLEMTERPRRSRRRARRGPTRNWKYRAWIRTLPCAACGSTRYVEAAHTGSDGGTSQKASDYSSIPLCTWCHHAGPESYHRIGREAFELLHGIDCRQLVKRLNHDWFAYASEVK